MRPNKTKRPRLALPRRHLVHIAVFHGRIEQPNTNIPLSKGGVFTETWWDLIEEVLGDERLAKTVRWKLYSDSFTGIGPFMQQHLRVGAAFGSRHFRLMLRFMEQGAELIQTEDHELHRRYDEKKTKANMRARDRFIAKRINETLGPGEWGILILGGAHWHYNLYLDKDIVCHEFLGPHDLERIGALSKAKIER